MADMQSVKDDIAFMRALAAEGRSAPLLGGVIMIAAGLIYGLASLAHYLVDKGVVVASPIAYPIIWGGATAIFLVAIAVVKGRLRGRPGHASPGNRAMRGVWRGVGWGIAALAATLGIAASRLHSPEVLWLFPSVILILYGAAWTLAAQMSELRWMAVIAALSFVCAAGMAFLIGQPELYLGYAAALMLTAVLPGWLLMRQEPSDVV